MILYTLLTVLLVLSAIAILVMNSKQRRMFEENQTNIKRLTEEVERLRREIEKKQQTSKRSEGLRLVSGDEDEDGLN